MEQSIIIDYLNQNQDYLFGDEDCSEELINALVNVSDECLPMLNSFPFRKPSTLKLIAIFPGSLGVDRLYLGDIKKALLKYFTLGGLGIWWIKDIKSAKKRCREYNCKKLLAAINDPSVAREMIERDEKIKKTFVIAKAVAPAIKQGAKDFQNSLYVD